MSGASINKLGILAGKGALPKQLVEHCKSRNIPYFILAFEESLNEELIQGEEHKVVPLGAIGSGLQALKNSGVSELVLAGNIQRPSLRKLNMDDQAKRLLKKLGTKILGGDDALLKALINFLEEEGFTIVAAHDILGGMTIKAGTPTKCQPDADHKTSIQKAMSLLKNLGPMDIGQALVIEDEYTLGIEAAEGTDGLITRCKEYMKAEKRAILVKAKKTGQDVRADMPTIGPATIKALASAGYAGIAIEADNVLIVDKESTLALADQHHLFISAVTK